MLEARNRAVKRGGLGVWFPSPSEYEPLSFVLSLTDSYCTELLLRPRYAMWQRIRLAANWSFVTIVMLILINQNPRWLRNLFASESLEQFLSALFTVAILPFLLYLVASNLVRAILELLPRTRLSGQ